MKNWFIFLFISLKMIPLQAQIPLTEFAPSELKYWKLRGRLTGDENNRDVYNGFMNVGAGDGMSIIAGSRNPEDKRNNYDFSQFGGCSAQTINGVPVYSGYTNGVANEPLIIDPRDGRDVKGVLKFSDNSLIYLGNYIAVLATEWALLHREFRSTVQTERELYYAMLAIDRLDLKGETVYGLSQSKNGFLMRADVDEEFALSGTGDNIDLVTSVVACQNNSVACDNGVNPTSTTPNSMSQDEVIGLIMGFALMRKMMPEYASYNGVALRQWSREITQRIVFYVRSAGATNFWTIVDPDQQNRVCRGSMTMWNSYALAAVAQYIGGYTFQNGWSLGIGKFVWQWKKNHFAQNNYDIVLGMGMPTQMQADLGLNAYEYIDIPGNNTWSHDGAFNVSMFTKLLACSFTAPRPYFPYLDLTGKALINTVSQTYLKNIYELMGSVIYGYFPHLSEAYWRGQFNSLSCGCNCLQGTNANGYKGCDNYYSLVPPNIPATPTVPPGNWSVEDRWAFNGYYGGSYPANGDDPGTLNEFNGLDYMLAYNLYRWKYFAGGYSDRVRRDWQENFPFLTQPNPNDNNNQYLIGSTTYPYETKAVFAIQSSNTIINSATDVTFSAGSDIKLLPGFHAKPGSVFKTIIKEFDCQPNISQVPNSLYVSWKNGVDTFKTSYYSDDMDTIVDIQLDGDSVNYYDEGPPVDTNAFILTYTNNIDTFVYDLNTDYVFTDSGEIVYAPQNNKSTLDEATINNISLYPNPANTKAFVEYTLYNDSEVKISVSNELGQVMQHVADQDLYKQRKGKQQVTLNTANLNSGIYFCIVELNGRRQVLKFSVIK